jgi:hypothetical protein
MARSKANGDSGEGKVNKMELVRQALATLGNTAMPGEIADHIKDSTGGKVEMSTNMVSNYKSSILKKKGQSPRRKGRRRGRPAAVAPTTEVQTTVHSGLGADGVPWKDLRSIRDMAQRLGLSRLRELVELLH